MRQPTPCRRAIMHGAWLASCARVPAALPLAIVGLLAGPPVGAQSVVLEPVPGLAEGSTSLDWTYFHLVAQITRDGRHLVVRKGLTGDTIIVETRSGATVLDTSSMRTPERTYATSLLSPDGTHLVDVARGAVGIVYARRLDTGVETEIFRDVVTDLALSAVADGATRAATQSAINTSMGKAFSVGGQGIPVLYAGTQCAPARPDSCPVGPLTMSDDGAYLVYRGGIWSPAPAPTTLLHDGLMVFDVAANANRPLPVAHPDLAPEPWPANLGTRVISGNGEWIGLTAPTQGTGAPRAVLVHRATGTATLVAPYLGDTTFLDLSDDGRLVLVASPYALLEEQRLWVVDRRSGIVTRVSNPLDSPAGSQRLTDARLSGDGSTVVATFASTWVPMSFDRFTLSVRLDSDGDAMADAWETAFGLDPSTAADAVLDPDGDGRTSAQEYAEGTHPSGTPVRYFAEGASGTFFATSLALFNPTDAAVTANVRFLGPDGAAASIPVVVPALGPAYLEVDHANLAFSEFSLVVESPIPLPAERRMTWDRARRYGSHASNGAAAPASTWHFAEGATIAGLQTFLLLQNPGDTPATVTVRYLLATATSAERVHVVPARSRATVWVNQEGAPLQAAEFATTVVSDHPIVAERAMYRDALGEIFAAGSVATGTVEPRSSFLFAEGATGSFFDTYLLLANPGETPARVSASYVRPFDPQQPSLATQVDRTHVVAARSRHTIWVGHEAPDLRNTPVSARLSADVPIVAERAMWWPGPTAETWRGTHAEGAPGRGASRWVAADLVTADAPESAESFLLVSAAPTYLGVAPQLRVSLSCADGTRATREYFLRFANQGSRTTLWLRQEFPEVVGRRCGAVVESLPVDHYEGVPAQTIRYPASIVVESAVYFGDFAAGAAVAATALVSGQ